jgi:hypothetical protein
MNFLSKCTKYIKLMLSFFLPRHNQIEDISFLGRPHDQIFLEIYKENKWGDNLSLSGPGSNLIQTEVIRSILPHMLDELECQSILDVPCGDFFWMRSIKMNIQYTGGDIVTELIEKNQKQYGDNQRKFITIDLTRDNLPKADFVLCRDCLVHFSNNDTISALNKIKRSGSIYLLTTTFTKRKFNKDILTGSWHPINLQLPPFNLPTPLRLINEKCPHKDFRDKSLGLWRTIDIPDFN